MLLNNKDLYNVKFDVSYETTGNIGKRETVNEKNITLKKIISLINKYHKPSTLTQRGIKINGKRIYITNVETNETEEFKISREYQKDNSTTLKTYIVDNSGYRLHELKLKLTPIVQESYRKFQKEVSQSSNTQKIDKCMKLVKRKLNELNKTIQYTSKIKESILNEGNTPNLKYINEIKSLYKESIQSLKELTQ